MEFEEKKDRGSLRDSGRTKPPDSQKNQQQQQQQGQQQQEGAKMELDKEPSTPGESTTQSQTASDAATSKMEVEPNQPTNNKEGKDSMEIDKPHEANSTPTTQTAPPSDKQDAAAAPAKVVRVKEVNRIAWVHVLNRRPMGPRMDVFSKPFIISIDRLTATRSQVHKLIFERVETYLAPATLPQLNLALVDLLGENPGEVIPNDEQLFKIDEAVSAIAIEWDKDILHGLGLMNRKEVHFPPPPPKPFSELN